MPSSGPNSCGTGASVSGIGTLSWGSPSSINAEDGGGAFSGSWSFGTRISYWLKATNFGFAIPSGATIDGIIVEIRRFSAHTGANRSRDNSLKIVKGDVISGSELAATTTDYPSTYAYASYGSSSNLWGLSWTHTDINATDFGVALSTSFYSGGKVNVTCAVDHIRITVHYTTGGGSSAIATLLAGD